MITNIEYILPPYNISDEAKLSIVRNAVIEEIIQYDESEDVNSCIISIDGNRITYWANKNERDSLKGALQDCIDIGRETYKLDLREYGISITLPCEQMLGMLKQLEIYAVDCYNVTSQHMFNVKSLNNIEEIMAYDYTSGYPENLVFEV